MVYVDPDGEFFVPMLAGAAFGVLTNGINNLAYRQPFLRGAVGAAFMGGFNGALSFGIGQMAGAISNPYLQVGAKTLAHGTLGGVMAKPGYFGAGFLAGSLSSLSATGMGALVKNAPPGAQFMSMTYVSGVMGGVGSSLAGGNAMDGFRTGMISGGLNHALHYGLLGMRLAISSKTGQLRHLFGPDAKTYAITFDAGIGGALSAEAGKLHVLRGPEEGWYDYYDLGSGGGIQAGAEAGGEVMELYSSANEVKAKQFYGARHEYILSYDGTFSLGYGGGIGVVYSSHTDGTGFTIGVGISGTWGFSAPITISWNKGASAETIEQAQIEYRKAWGK